VPSSPGITHDYHLDDRLIALQATLNAGHVLRLFQNNFVPKPGDGPSQFTEATFGGYVPVILDGGFTSPVFVTAGQWQMAAGSYQFQWTNGVAQTVYGWYLTSNYPAVRFSYLFSSPIVFSSGVSIYVQPIIQDWSYSVVP